MAKNSDRAPLHERLWFKMIALVLGVVAMLVLLGFLFSPRYWRF